MNGTANSPKISRIGSAKIINVSASGGLSDNKPNSHKNGQSGRGFAPLKVGSGGPLGPFGPTIAAIVTTTITTSAEKITSLSIASPKNGSPRRSSSSYWASYVSGSTKTPGFGGALIPFFSTNHK